MSEKGGTAWIQNLNKQQIIEELKRRGIEAEEQAKFDELHKRLTMREDCKKESERTNKVEIKMEYTAKLDFKIETDDWEEFVERVELYFEANGIENEGKKRAILLTKIDAETYKIVRKVCAPKKPRETQLEEIIAKMKKYVKPEINETMRRQ